MSTEPNTGLEWQEANSLTTDALHNQVVDLLAVWLNCSVLAVDQAAPSGSEVEGDRYIVGTGTGLFAGMDGKLAILRGGTWQFHAPPEGASAVNLDDGFRYVLLAGAWATPSVAGAVTSVNGASGTVVLDDGDVKSVVTELTSGTTVTVDCSLGRNFTLTLGHNVGTLTLSNLAGAGYATEVEIEIKQPGSGGPYTFALPAAFKALGGSDTAIASAANAVTVLSAKTFDNGTTWRYAMQESA